MPAGRRIPAAALIHRRLVGLERALLAVAVARGVEYKDIARAHLTDCHNPTETVLLQKRTSKKKHTERKEVFSRNAIFHQLWETANDPGLLRSQEAVLRILGYINRFDELAGQSDHRLGRKEAAHGMVSALLEYSDHDQLQFFLPFPSAVQYFQKEYEPWLGRPENRDRIRFYLSQNLADAMAVTPLRSDPCRNGGQLFSRALSFTQSFRQGTLSGHVHSAQFKLLGQPYSEPVVKVLPGPESYDSVFCTSRAAEEYYRTALSLTAEGS